MIFHIRELCGEKSYLARFKVDKLDIEKIIEILGDKFEIVAKKENLVRLRAGEKSFTVFDYGEIFFNGFEREEVEEICKKIAENL